MSQDGQVWLITGTSRGMGVHLVKAALRKGHRVVATARKTERLKEVFAPDPNLLTVALDVTDPDSVRAAVSAAVEEFGRIDVLVNNAGMFYAGFFETMSPDQVRAQMEVNFFGTLNVTRAVLPWMRERRSGRVVTFSSMAGVVGGEFTSAYAASKFALEGWMESITPELARFGISTTLVEPGMFRTELLVEGSSTIWPELEIADYADAVEQTVRNWQSLNGQQPGNPELLARQLVDLVDSENPPARWAAGADAVQAIQAKGQLLVEQAGAYDVSEALGFDE